ncbi:MAG: HAD family hydrolase, partial [Pseudonocardiales bacterium]
TAGPSETTLPVRLLLWDVDHTLLELHQLHYDLYARALPAAFGRQVDELPDMTGRTDRDSSTEYLRAHNIEPNDENLTRFWNTLVEQLDTVQDNLPQIGSTTHGAEATLAVLAEVPDLYQSVLTGNVRALAERKLSAFALDKYLDFDIGGYGEDSAIRSDLVTTARDRLTAKHYVTVELAHTILIGDTPRDIEAAHSSGSRIVAVATGKSTYKELAESGADVVIADLTNPRQVLDALLCC